MDSNAGRNTDHNAFSLDAAHDDAVPHTVAAAHNAIDGTVASHQHDTELSFHANGE